ncbi:MAG: ATP-dependent DNA helicase [Spirochaetales bacterium]|nr:ATP-dependent DNA helicase [Spirochaetales bacterium]
MTDQELFGIFDQGGLLSSNLDSFEFREGQLLMARDVLECYRQNGIGAIEAGTGIGKSFAYLVPALFYAFEDKSDRTVIATSTINLQKQLMDKDLPALFRTLGKDCPVAIAVGRNNYLCLRRLAEEVKANELYAYDGVSDISLLNSFAAETESGLRTDYRGRLDFQVWSSVCSDSDFCMGGKCPYFTDCFYFKAKKKLSEASVIICNHHLLFVDSNTRFENSIDYSDDAILPPFRHLVIDEAHNMERHATDLFTSTYSAYSLRRQMDFLYDNRGIRGLGTGRMLEELRPFCNDEQLYNEILDFFALVRAKAETLNMATLNLLEYNKLAHLLVTKANVGRIVAEVGGAAGDVVENGGRLVARLERFASLLKLEENQMFRAEEFLVHVSRISDILDRLKTFMDWEHWDEDIHYLDIEKHGANRYVTFNIAPLEVSDILADALFRKLDSVICTSATLDLHDDFTYWSSGVGLPIEGRPYLRKVYPSPFDYRNRLMLLTPFDTPTFSREKEAEYADFTCETVYDAVSSSGGGALVLFTSFRLLEYVYEKLKPRFSVMGLSTLKQGDNDRYALLEQFKEDEDSVLFATDSFWEGVDAPGNTLRMVIITKLPFRMPDDPIYKARYSKLEEDGKSGFYCLSLPDATMRLKQGYGRLMRHTTDKGIVLILDSRIISKSYGALMLRSLPESYHPETETKSLGQKIESFLF